MSACHFVGSCRVLCHPAPLYPLYPLYPPPHLTLSFPIRRSSDLIECIRTSPYRPFRASSARGERAETAVADQHVAFLPPELEPRSEEHTSELQSPCNLVCRLLLEKKKNTYNN